MIRRVFLAVVFAVVACAAIAESLMPRIGGVGRFRYELDTQSGEGKFAVRNARLSATGAFEEKFVYFVNVDFCDRGKITILDAYGSFKPTQWLDLRMGQFRMPFGDDSFVVPARYIFANRSFIGRYLGNVRAVGAQAALTVPGTPLKVSAGVFNPTRITDHNRWTKSYAAATRIILETGPWRVTTGASTIKPDTVRMVLTNLGVNWHHDRFTADAEYMLRHYGSHAHDATHGYLAYVDYAMPLKSKTFNRMSLQARFDGTTAFTSTDPDAYNAVYGVYDTTLSGRNRVTAGATVTHISVKNSFRALFRLNYEKYIQSRHAIAPGRDAVTAEFVVSF